MTASSGGGRSQWRRDAVALSIAVVIAAVTYFFGIQTERARQLTYGRRADQLRDASVAAVAVARHVGTSLSAADHILRNLSGGGSPRDLAAGVDRWNAADSAWIAEKFGLSHTMDLALQSDSVDAAWSHMDSTVFRLGEALNRVLAPNLALRSQSGRAALGLAASRRDSTQAALERFLGLMHSGLAVR